MSEGGKIKMTNRRGHMAHHSKLPSKVLTPLIDRMLVFGNLEALKTVVNVCKNWALQHAPLATLACSFKVSRLFLFALLGPDCQALRRNTSAVPSVVELHRAGAEKEPRAKTSTMLLAQIPGEGFRHEACRAWHTSSLSELSQEANIVLSIVLMALIMAPCVYVIHMTTGANLVLTAVLIVYFECETSFSLQASSGLSRPLTTAEQMSLCDTGGDSYMNPQKSAKLKRLSVSRTRCHTALRRGTAKCCRPTQRTRF